jgi:hypothetical protein
MSDSSSTMTGLEHKFINPTRKPTVDVSFDASSLLEKRNLRGTREMSDGGLKGEYKRMKAWDRMSESMETLTKTSSANYLHTKKYPTHRHTYIPSNKSLCPHAVVAVP